MIPNPNPNIKDDAIVDNKAWSSKKIMEELQEIYDHKITKEASGAVASFNTCLKDDLVSGVVNIESISGFSSCSVTRTGKNLFDEASATLSNLSLSNHVFTNTNTDTRANLQLQVMLIDDDLQTIQTLVFENVTATGAFTRTITITNSGYSKLLIKHNGINRDFRIIVPFTYPKGTVTISANFLGVDVSTVGGLSFENLQIEPGSTATTYEAYNGETKTINLGQTVYDGSLNLTTGELTIGSQTYQLTPQEIVTLIGENNIWADTGDITLQYKTTIKCLIDNN